jgi:two-component system sensor histidine kinase HydH
MALVLEEERSDGLRYLAYISSERRVEAGTPAAPVVEQGLDPGEARWEGTVVRYAFGMRGRPLRGSGLSRRFEGSRPDDERRRPPEGGEPPEGPPPPGMGALGLGPSPPFGPPPPRFGEPRPPGPRPPLLVVEFEPRTWGDLSRTANATLALGSVTALAMGLLSLWVWRSTRRLLAIEREAARARHLAALGEMSAVLAHEIRNPLTSLKGHSQLLVETLGGLGLDKPKAKADRVVHEALRLEQITNDLLDFVKQGELDLAPTDLARLVRQAVTEVVPADRLRLKVPEEDTLVRSVDATKLTQLVDNLARNAVQAGDGPVEIALAVEDGGAVLSVRDHGEGIPAGQEDRIFEPFVTTRVRGTGLGLAIARRIADRHAGTLTASNHPEGGALFRLTLPGEARGVRD